MTSSQARPRDAAPIRSDETLFAAYRDQSDEAALESLLERNWNGAYHIALSFTRDPASAEDLAQEACLKVLKAAQDGRDIEAFAPWLRTVVANLARSQHRSQRSRARREEKVAMSREEAHRHEDEDKSQALRELTEGLETTQRQALELHYGLGLSHAEVAATLGCAKGTISTRIRAGLERLRQSFGKRGVTLSLAALTQLYQREARAATASAPPMPSLAVLLARAGAGGSLAAGAGVGLSAAALAPWLAGGVVIAAGALLLAGLLKTGAPPRTPPVTRRVATRSPAAEPRSGAVAAISESPETAGVAENEAAGPKAGGPASLGAPARMLGARVPQHFGLMQLIAGSSDRELISLSNHDVRIWNAETMRARRILKAPMGPRGPRYFREMTLAREGQALVTRNDGGLVIWDLKTGDARREVPLPKPVERFELLGTAPDGRLMLKYQSKPLAFLDLDTAALSEWRPGYEVYAAAFSPDGSLLATAENHSGPRPSGTAWMSGRRSLMVWDARRRERRFSFFTRTVVTPKLTEDFELSGLCFSGDGNTLFASVGKHLRAWDMVEGRELKPHRSFPWFIGGLCYSPQRNALIVGLGDGSLHEIDPADRSTRQVLSCQTGGVHSLCLSRDGRIVRSGSGNEAIQTWDLEAGTVLDSESAQTGPVRSLRFSPDGQLLATAGENQLIFLWDVASGQRVKTLGFESMTYIAPPLPELKEHQLSPDRRNVYLSSEPAFVFRDNNSLLAASDQNCRGRRLFLLLDLATGELRETIFARERALNSCPLILTGSRGDRWFAARSEGSEILELASGATLLKPPAGWDSMPGAALSEDEETLACVINRGERAEALIFDVGSGRLRRRIPLSEELPQSRGTLKLSPAADRLFITDLFRLKAYDAASGERLWTREGLRFAAASDTRVAAFDNEGRVVILSRDGRLESRSQPLEASPTTAAFGPEGARLAVGLRDGRSLIYAFAAK